MGKERPEDYMAVVEECQRLRRENEELEVKLSEKKEEKRKQRFSKIQKALKAFVMTSLFLVGIVSTIFSFKGCSDSLSQNNCWYVSQEGEWDPTYQVCHKEWGQDPCYRDKHGNNYDTYSDAWNVMIQKKLNICK